MLIQKQGAEEHKVATKEEHGKQYHVRTRILIIDDEPDTVNEALLALKNFKAGLYDLLIIDIVMPEMDGFELYEEIRKIDNKVKVCFITAFEVNYQALRAVFHSATTTDDIGCFIRKPFYVDNLIKHIEAELI